MSVVETVNNKLSRKQKIFLVLAVSAMWSVTTAYGVYTKQSLERFRIESRNESDRMSAQVFEEVLKKLIEKKLKENEDPNSEWTI